MKRLIIIPLMLLLLAFSVSAIKVDKAECYDDGSFEIGLKANSDQYAYTKEMIVSADDKRVKGEWDNDKIMLTSSAYAKYATFTGKQNQLLEEKEYDMKIMYKLRTESTEEDAVLEFKMQCPGLLFTCNKLGIRIKDCLTAKSGKFTANLDIYGLEQSPRGTMDPLKVIDYILDAQILYKDINGITSKRGSLPQGAAITKTGENQYHIEAYFDKYTTNHVEKMWVKFNDQLIRPCNPADYPNVILSHSSECEYKETEEDYLAKLIPEVEPVEEEEPYDIEKEIQDLETKKSQIETRLKELYEQTGYVNDIKEELTDLEEGTKNTGLTTGSVGVSKKQEQLNIMIFSMLGVFVVGGLLLTYLYKRGYFY